MFRACHDSAPRRRTTMGVQLMPITFRGRVKKKANKAFTIKKKRRPLKQYRPSAHMPHAHWGSLDTVNHPLSITGGGPLAYSATHAVPRGGTQYCRYCRARCTLHVKSSPSDGWSGAIWTDPAGPKYGTTTRALATWTAPGWTDQRFVVGYVDRFCCVDRYSRCCVDRNWYWNYVGDTFSFY